VLLPLRDSPSQATKSPKQPYQLRTPETLSLSYPRMSRRNNEDAQIRPDNRPSSPSTFSTPGHLRSAQTSLSSVHLPDAIDPSQRQCAKTSYAGAWTEEAGRGNCHRNILEPHETRYGQNLRSLEERNFDQASVRLMLLGQHTPTFQPGTIARMQDQSLGGFSVRSDHIEHCRRAAQHALVGGRCPCDDDWLFYQPCYFCLIRVSCFNGVPSFVLDLVFTRDTLHLSLKLVITPTFRQENQRITLRTRHAVNDLALSSRCADELLVVVQSLCFWLPWVAHRMEDTPFERQIQDVLYERGSSPGPLRAWKPHETRPLQTGRTLQCQTDPVQELMESC
jgi:hypothetical protein